VAGNDEAVQPGIDNQLATVLTAPHQVSDQSVRSGSKQTAKHAIEILVQLDPSFKEPTPIERKSLLMAFASRRKAIHGAAFDVVKLSRSVDLSKPDIIIANIDAVCLCEIKSTNRHSVGSDLRGYFFNLSTAELLVAQTLGGQYRFLFVNTVTRSYIEMALPEIFSRARGIYPTWSIRF
jgi:hypothetical protein